MYGMVWTDLEGESNGLKLMKKKGGNVRMWVVWAVVKVMFKLIDVQA